MNEAQETEQLDFTIQRIYAKDLSFESPQAPHVFLEEWEPNVQIELDTHATALEEDSYEVTVAVTVTVKTAEKVAFLIEATQAGIFSITSAPKEHLSQVLGSFCPTILFPYLRETISNMVMRGGFPQLYLAPVNFEMLYQERLKQLAEEEKEKTGDVTTH